VVEQLRLQHLTFLFTGKNWIPQLAQSADRFPRFFSTGVNRSSKSGVGWRSIIVVL
jgi:hypothetical protein